MDRKILTLVCLSITLCINAVDIKSYYSSLEGKSGQTLLNAVVSISQSGKKVLSYNDMWANRSGADYTSDGYVWDMYSDCRFSSNDHCSGTEFSDCDCYFGNSCFAVCEHQFCSMVNDSSIFLTCSTKETRHIN